MFLIKIVRKDKNTINKGQNLATKLIVAFGYNLTKYLFIGGKL